MMDAYHIPVLAKEIVELLALKPGDTVIDCTIGGGGHAFEILKSTAPSGRLMGIDGDKDAIKAVESRIRTMPSKSDASLFRKRIILVNDNFVHIGDIAGENGFTAVNGVLLDLGVSSYQLDRSEAGFSFRRDNLLEMQFLRTNKGGKNASEVVNTYSKQKLKEIFKKYGEIKNSGDIAERIAQYRAVRPIQTTASLVRAVCGPSPKTAGEGGLSQNYKERKLLAKVWQAIRIEVNDELNNLTATLPASVDLLKSGGRIAVISYHSLEDRIVKTYFRLASKRCLCPPRMPICTCKHKETLNVITRKPITPTESECRMNNRARSAKLRVAEKV